MLINHWYALAESTELGDRPLGVKALGQPLVLFRDSAGQAHCLSDVCIHKGGSLCQGETVQGAVECPYHGWRFDGSGACVAIPSLEAGRNIPRRARVDGYPTAERWGLVWAFLGDLPEAERPPLPDFYPEYEQQTGEWRTVRGKAQFDCSWVRAIENGVDRSHAVFVHTDFGNPQIPVVTDYPVEDRDGRLYSASFRKPLNKRGAWREVVPDERDERKTEVQICVAAPSIRIQMHMQPPWSMFIVTAYTPIDPWHTRLHFIHNRNFLLEPEQDADALRRVYFVLEEDAVVLKHLQPKLVPPTLADELHIVADKHGTLYRRKVMEAAARGWLIDHRAMQEDGERFRAIPCPARRADPSNWVHQPVILRSPARLESVQAI